ncbi:MAG: DNA polymerase III subunit gamma/tau [Ruminococcaceae bacterium]|nr:DNA polymerase III subunit gamma/tau [Oscillospiraceae bacterium]
MYKALYRKWRPQDFDTVCGQNHITDVLKYQIANGKFSHAYLFCGSRGTGKTSCAKIMAKAVNCEHPKNGNPCNECAACRNIDEGLATDVIEMDAASNNGVGDVRDIRDEVVFSPAELRYRVYIIDEVHMLSASAFNALLKTLEEPPSHVIFILATTELQKLPNTIISRCQRYDFRRISTETLMGRLKTIAQAENISLTDDGAFLIARMAAGGMRDAISLFELCAGGGGIIDEALASSILGAGNRGAIFSVVKSISLGDYEKIFDAVNDIMMHSGDLSVFWQELIDVYRDMMVCKTCRDARAYLDVTENEYESLKALAKAFSMETLVYHTRLLEGALPSLQKATLAKRSTAELTLIRLCEPRLSADTTALLSRLSKLEEEVSRLRLGIPDETPIAIQAEASASESAIKEAPKNAMETDARSKNVSTDEFKALAYWPRLLEALMERKPSLLGFFQKSKGYYNKEKGFLIKVASEFAASLIAGPDISLTVKTLLSEFEGRNVLSEPFTVLSDAKVKNEAIHIIDELEELIGQND